MTDMLPPEAWFKLMNLKGGWDRISLANVKDVADLKDSIRDEVPFLRNNYAASQLIIKAAKNTYDINQAKKFDARESLASILNGFNVVLPEDITLARVQEIFAENIMLFVDAPTAFQSVGEVIDFTLRGANSIGSISDYWNMPLKQRQFDQELTIVRKNVLYHIRNSKEESAFHMLVSSGAPGIGKTRFGQEMFNHIKKEWTPIIIPQWTEQVFDKKTNQSVQVVHEQQTKFAQPNFLYLYLNFGNDVRLTDNDKELSVDQLIAIRIAYAISGKFRMNFDEFKRKVVPYKDLFTLSEIFMTIRSKFPENQDLLIFLHIDEFQVIDNVGKMWGKNNLFIDVMNTVKVFMLGPQTKSYFVQTFLSGTASQLIISSKVPTGISYHFVSCPLLSMKSIIEIVDHYAAECNAPRFPNGHFKWKTRLDFLQLLGGTGGLPRALLVLLEHCFDILNNNGTLLFFTQEQKYSAIFSGVKEELDRRYNIRNLVSKKPTLYKELLYLAITGTLVTLDQCVDAQYPESTIQALERDSHIILSKYDDTKFTIQIPLFFVDLYNDIIKLVHVLGGTFAVGSELYWEGYKEFVAYHDTFRTNLLIDHGKKQVTLGELYPGAIGRATTKDILVKLKKLPVHYARGQSSITPPASKYIAQEIEWENPCTIIFHGMSASFGDFFKSMEVVNNPDFRSIILSGQVKWDYNSEYFEIKNLIAEDKKNISARDQQKEKEKDETKQLREKLSDYRIITVLFTTQPFRGNPNDVPEDCLLIVQENFEKYFGPVFTSCATFLITRDINPNFAEPKRMQNGIDQVGIETSKKIAKRRLDPGPFSSEDEFYEEYTKLPWKRPKLSFFPFDL